MAAAGGDSRRAAVNAAAVDVQHAPAAGGFEGKRWRGLPARPCGSRRSFGTKLRTRITASPRAVALQAGTRKPVRPSSMISPRADVCGDDRQFCRQRLDDRQRKSLAQRGEHEYVAAAQEVYHIRPEAEQGEMRVQVRRADAPDVLAAPLGVAGERGNGSSGARDDGGRSFHQDSVGLCWPRAAPGRSPAAGRESARVVVQRVGVGFRKGVRSAPLWITVILRQAGDRGRSASVCFPRRRLRAA